MKIVRTVMLIVIVMLVVGCGSKTTELEKSPCACEKENMKRG